MCEVLLFCQLLWGWCVRVRAHLRGWTVSDSPTTSGPAGGARPGGDARLVFGGRSSAHPLGVIQSWRLGNACLWWSAAPEERQWELHLCNVFNCSSPSVPYTDVFNNVHWCRRLLLRKPHSWYSSSGWSRGGEEGKRTFSQDGNSQCQKICHIEFVQQSSAGVLCSREVRKHNIHLWLSCQLVSVSCWFGGSFLNSQYLLFFLHLQSGIFQLWTIREATWTFGLYLWEILTVFYVEVQHLIRFNQWGDEIAPCFSSNMHTDDNRSNEDPHKSDRVYPSVAWWQQDESLKGGALHEV